MSIEVLIQTTLVQEYKDTTIIYDKLSFNVVRLIVPILTDDRIFFIIS